MYSKDDYTSIGAVFRLSDNALSKKLEDLISLMPGVFEIRDTAGINQLYLMLEKNDPDDMLQQYYGPVTSIGKLGAVA